MTANDFLFIHFPAFLITVGLIILCVLIHYEALITISWWVEKLPALRRMRMILVILGIMTAHLVEIWVFALGYLGLSSLNLGALLHGDLSLGILDIVYFSGVTFSTVGYGDVVPQGPARFMSAMEALTGLVLISWSASFTYFEMQHFWRQRGSRGRVGSP